MGCSFEQAYKLANQVIGDSLHIANALETDNYWVFGVADSKGITPPGSSGLFISKTDGKISYPLPPVPSIVLGKKPTIAEKELETSKSISLP